MTVESAVEHDIELLGPKAAESALAATALALAREMDSSRNGGTSKSMIAKSLNETMSELRALAPPKQEADEVERARKRREARRTASQTASSS